MTHNAMASEPVTAVLSVQVPQPCLRGPYPGPPKSGVPLVPGVGPARVGRGGRDLYSSRAATPAGDERKTDTYPTNEIIP